MTKTTRRALVAVIVLETAGLLAWGLERFVFRFNRGYTVAYAAAALAQRYLGEQGVPQDWSDLEANGWYFRNWRLPASAFEKPGRGTGPYMAYLPVERWDGNTPSIIAVTPSEWPGQSRSYIIAGDCSVHRAEPNEFRHLQEKDNLARQKTGDPHRWQLT